MLMFIAALLVLGIATSTREGRSEWDTRLRRHNPKFAALAIVLWVLILFGCAGPSGR